MSAIKIRTIPFLLATLVFTLLSPLSITAANGDSLTTISISEIQGVTPPVPGSTPVQTILPNAQFTGTITWSNMDGDLIGNFETSTIYAATITLTATTGFTLEGVANNFFTVEGASRIIYFNDSSEVTAIFRPATRDGLENVDTSFANEGTFSIKDFFGDSPLVNESNTAVGPVKIDRIALDSLDRVVVLASFYGADNQITSAPGTAGTAIGSGYANTVGIAMQSGNSLESSAAIAARNYRPTIANVEVRDWYLPSIGDLWELIGTGADVDTMSVDYWSSTQVTASRASYISFDTALESDSGKSSYLAVRPIRSGTSESAMVGDMGPGGGTIFYTANEPFNCGPTLSTTCNYLEAAPYNWSGVMGDPSITWATASIDNHILFRLKADGSYDEDFGNFGPTIRKDLNDSPKPYVPITTTCSSYTERLDLEIDSEDRILVMLSGSTDGLGCQGYHNLVARFTSNGSIDFDFGDEGVIGSFAAQYGYPPALFADITLDANDGIDDNDKFLVVSFSNDEIDQVFINKFNAEDGQIDESFGHVDNATAFITIGYPINYDPVAYRDIQIMADGSNGYIIAFSGGATASNSNSGSPEVVFTQLIRIDSFGDRDVNFKAPPDSGFEDDNLIFPYFLFTDLVSDGQTGFLLSGTLLSPVGPGEIFSVLFRLNLTGAIDLDFFGEAFDPELNPRYFSLCANTALVRNNNFSDSTFGIMVSHYCDTSSGKLAAFSPSGSFQAEYSLGDSSNNSLYWDESEMITQLLATRDGKLLILKGSRPKTGYFGFALEVSTNDGDYVPMDDSAWTEATISLLSIFGAESNPDELTVIGPNGESATVGDAINMTLRVSGGNGTYTFEVTDGSTLPAGLSLSPEGIITGTVLAAGFTVTNISVTDGSLRTSWNIEFEFDPASSSVSEPPVVRTAPTPIPYLKTLTTPKLSRKDDKLICTPGTYNVGYTLDGVNQGSATSLFTPSTFTYNLLINGVAQSSLTVTSATTTATWSIPSTSSGSLFTCSVTVNANGLTNSDRSSDNTGSIGSASAAQRDSLAAAAIDYAAALSANAKGYQKALVDNRTKWRSDTEKIRTDYYAERNRISSLPPTKATRALSSAALKAYTTAIKKRAADYAASKPAALASKEAADKAALDAKTTAIAKANATYGTFIESIGYGVLIP